MDPNGQTARKQTATKLLDRSDHASSFTQFLRKIFSKCLRLS
ncbi:hypothetical protein RBSH_05503 [Rhodopirellula baltica SH28]|uniref:Uncharacterized protein n=1 Tax=Rhodopirellula baltica SH28 TaxID=993517 RepID=K5E0E5_RHOBT|nr:hypothetical protein RBSH_05503 [Rhodopirellula baltica SH28]